MERYEAYKDSGVEWIGEIPEDWATIPIKAIADQSQDSSFTDGDWIESPYITDEGIRYLTSGNIGDGKFKYQGNGHITEQTFEALHCKYAYPNDLVFSRLNAPFGRSCILPDDENEYVLAVDNVILRPDADSYDKRFLCYVTECDRYHNFVEIKSRGTAMQRISRTELGRVKLPVPSRHTQTQIADYLDKRTTAIDSIISETERSIGLLREYRKSVISEAVTKGLDPNAPMKDSGIDWIGDIPETWQAISNKYIFVILKRIAGINGPKVLSITQRGIVEKDIESGEGQLAASYENYQWVHPGDFAMNHMDLLTGWVDCSKLNGVTSPDYRVFAPINDDVSRDYFKYVFQHCYSAKIFYRLGQGVSGLGRWRMPSDEFKKFKIPVPPLSEQKEIANYLDEKTAEIDSLIEDKEKQVELLKEYRKSLISEAVTGKFKVPGVS